MVATVEQGGGRPQGADPRQGALEADFGQDVVGVQGASRGPASSPTLCKEAAKAIPVRDLVAALKLDAAPGRDNYRCPKHNGPYLHVFDDNAICFSVCGRLDNIELVRAALRVSFPEALRWLSSRFPNARSTRPGPDRARAKPIDFELHAAILTFLIKHLELTYVGRRLMEQRGLDPDRAASIGEFRSIGARDWPDIRTMLTDQFGWGALQRAGLQGLGWFGPGACWPAPVSVLVIPYLEVEKVVAIRLRRLTGEDDWPPYWAPKGCGTPAVPFGAPCVYGHCARRRVHITRGEINAWTLLERRELAIGAPGPRAVRPEWFEPLRECSGLVIWGEPGDVGQAFLETTQRALDKSLGAEWLATHRIDRPGLFIDQDANGLHCEGLLHLVLEDLRQ